MNSNLRLLPAVMVSAMLLLTLKVAGLITGTHPLVPPVEAAGAAAGHEPAGGGHAPAPEAGASAHEGETQAAPRVDLAARPARKEAPSEDVLSAIAARRKALDARQADLDMREKLLAATEARIEDKIAELKTLKAEIDKVFRTEESRGEEKLMSLVKVYENMKPKDAAAVFEQLDMTVLLDIMERMNERRMAAVLAAMDPARAQDITVALATAAENRLSAIPRPAEGGGGAAPLGLPELEPILPENAG